MKKMSLVGFSLVGIGNIMVVIDICIFMEKYTSFPWLRNIGLATEVVGILITILFFIREAKGGNMNNESC